MTMLGIGNLLEKGADLLGMPEAVGDVLKIGAGILTADAFAIAGGAVDLVDNVVDLGEGGDAVMKYAQLFLGVQGERAGSGQEPEDNADLSSLLDNVLQAVLSRKG
jgi:hypothetical protein